MTTNNVNHEPGYKAVLVREETKDSLRDLRSKLPDRDLFQERRLVTAALELMIEDASNCDQAKSRLLNKAREIVKLDLESRVTE